VRKVTLLGLVGATYLMVAGGPYGLEDVVKGAGYFGAVLALLAVPLIWSLPTALMVSELSSAIPEEGGYYAWVKRALGPFWGFQEAWLSLTASIFDMAIYPILFVTYLGLAGKYAAPFLQTWGVAAGNPVWWEHLARRKVGDGVWVLGLGVGILVIADCALSNLRPARLVGFSSAILTLALLVPFAGLSVLAVVSPGTTQDAGVTEDSTAPPAAGGIDTETDSAKAQGAELATFAWVGALLFAMWNYMGWDNASTFAAEVEKPQRTYPLAMGCAVLLVTLTYVVPVAAASRSGIDPGKWDDGSWVDVGASLGGPGLGLAIGLGGMVMGYGMFNSLVLSYTRVPVVLAEDGYLPAVFRRRLRSGAPWVAVVACSLAWGLALALGLKRVLALDVILYGLSLLLEFAALVALRLREPNLRRPFRVPGGVGVALLLGVGPTLLVALAIWDQAQRWQREADDFVAPAEAVLLGAALAALGPVVYGVSRWLARKPDPGYIER
jgi:amino acid transporter